jgi:hypothetical protein
MMTATVDRQISNGLWIVVDSIGRKYKVEGDGSWSKGDKVAVISNRIVGRAGKQKVSAVYSV